MRIGGWGRLRLCGTFSARPSRTWRPSNGCSSPRSPSHIRRQTCTVSSRISNRSRERRVGQPEPDGLLLVVAGADAEHRPTAGEHVERRHHLGEQAGWPVRGGGRQREEPDALGVRGDEPERRVGLDLALEVAAQVVALPDVVGDVDGVEAGRLGGLDDVLEVRAERRRAAAPRRLGDVQPELHAISRCIRHSVQRGGLRSDHPRLRHRVAPACRTEARVGGCRRAADSMQKPCGSPMAGERDRIER